MSRLYPCVYYTEDGHCKKYSDDEVTSWCVQGPCTDETPSNADRIRMMTDEELAEWLKTIVQSMSLPIAFVGFDKKEMVEDWLEWLRLPVGYAKQDHMEPLFEETQNE